MSGFSIFLLIVSSLVLGVVTGFFCKSFMDYSCEKHFTRRVKRLYYRGGNSEKALNNLLANLAKNGNEAASSYLDMGRFFREQGEYERALKLHESLAERTDLNSDMQQKLLIELAEDYASVGNVSLAIRKLEFLQTEYPDNKEGLSLLAELQHRYSDTLKAKSK